MIKVEVVYALPEQQYLQTILVPEGTNALQAIELSGIQVLFPDVDFVAMGMGIFSQMLDGRGNPMPHEYVMREGDRLELYRPLQVDPKKARQLRAAKKNRKTK